MLAEITETYSTTSSTSTGLSTGATVAIAAVVVAIVVLHMIGMWKVLTKGGQPGAFSLLLLVGCLVPFAFLPVLRMIGRPAWWVVLLYIPIVNIVILAIISIDLARSFGKGTGYGIGLWLLAPLFTIMLGFGSSTYRGPSVATA